MSTGYDETSRKEICETNCIIEALSGNYVEIPDYCRDLCPEYMIDSLHREPDAACSFCPDGQCLRCRCDTGECLECCSCDLTFDNGCDCENEVCCLCTKSHRSFDPEKRKESDYDSGGAKIKYGAANVVPVNTYECSSCLPQKTCHLFWWC